MRDVTLQELQELATAEQLPARELMGGCFNRCNPCYQPCVEVKIQINVCADLRL